MAPDLQNLTVPQLKALCKEKGISGYSKLAKASLIKKLAEHGSTTEAASVDRALPPFCALSKGNRNDKPEQIVAPTSQSLGGMPSLLEQRVATPAESTQVRLVLSVGVTGTRSLSIPTSAAGWPEGTPVLKPSHPRESVPEVSRSTERGEQANEHPFKRQRLDEIKGYRSQEANQPRKAAEARMTHKAPKSIPLVVQAINNNRQDIVQTDKAVDAKRYIPLVIKPKIQGLLTVARAPAAVNRRSSTKDAVPSEYLDFPLTDETSFEFKAITFPPSLNQQKHASKLALILRDIGACDMSSLALSSRLLRYSGYLSASHHLQRWYPGRRLERLLVKCVSMDQVNLWPYRMIREVEWRMRKEGFGKSFLARLIGPADEVIDEKVWRSEHCSKQAVVAVRYLLTRCYFCISLNRDLGETMSLKVLDVQEVTQGIWCVKIVSRDWNANIASIKYYVLEATCEVIGNPVRGNTLPSRVDWSAYIQQYVQEGGEMGIDIMEHVRWTNHEEYVHGISKLWLKKTQEEGRVGEFKREVAKRYILACTMENSLSGRYMTSSEMSQELNGLPCRMGMGVGRKRSDARVNLFVPAHHHVESVHFTASSKRPLHPALAVVQTPSREYYILQDNGMQVGCEEEGVAEEWMEAIGCSRIGESTVGLV